MFGRKVTLNSGIKVKIWSDNDDCTLHVYDASTLFDAHSTFTTVINYSEVCEKDRLTLGFYKPEEPEQEYIADEQKTVILSEDDIVVLEAIRNLLSNVKIIHTLAEDAVNSLADSISPELLRLTALIDEFKAKDEKSIRKKRRVALINLCTVTYGLNHTRAQLLYDDIEAVISQYS